MKSARALAAGLLLATGLALGATPKEIEAAALVERAQSWQARGRDDLMRDALDRLLRLEPDHPEGLALEVRWLVRQGQDTEARRQLARLERVKPDHPAIPSLQATFRARGSEKERVQLARSLAKIGRFEEAAQAYREAFPDAFPDDDHALEYAQWLGATPEGWEAARVALADLAKRHPAEARYRLALAGHQVLRKPVPPEAWATLRELSADPAVSKAARQAWRRGVMQLDAVEESLPRYRDYLAVDAGDTAVRERYEALARVSEERRRLLADPGYKAKVQGLALLGEGKLEPAAARLREAVDRRPADGEALGNLGIVLMRQGNHDEAFGFLERAAEADRERGTSWASLARTSRYWSLVKRSSQAQDAGDAARAEALLREARGVDPREPYAAVSLGRLLAARGEAAEAGRLYREALALEPGHARALEGLIALELQAGRDESAERMIDALTPAQREAIGGAVDSLRAARLRERARALREGGRDAEAVALLEAAVRLDPDDPWLRHDLARLHAARGETAKGRALFAPLLARRPGDAQVRFAQALFLSGANEESEALAALEGIAPKDRSAGMTSLQRRLWVSAQGRRAEAFAARGEAGASRAVIAAMQSAIVGDVDLTIDVARLLDRLDEVEAFRVALAQLEASPLAPAQREAVDELRLSASLREARALREAGRPADALAVLGAVQVPPAATSMRTRIARERAAALRAAGRLDEADQALREVIAANPGDVDAILDRAELAIGRGDAEGARKLIEQALRAGPEEPRALAAASRVAEREGRLDEAIAFQQRALASAVAREVPPGTLSRLRLPALAGEALAVDPAPTPPAPSPYGFRPLAEMLDQETPWVAAGIDWRHRSGSNGKARISLQQVPLEWRQGSLAGGRWFVRSDLARVDAGSLDLADGDAATFGSVLLCQPGCATGSIGQRDHGVALGAGYERGPWRFDVGSTPFGFRVVNAVGGVSYRGDAGLVSYTVEASRRAESSSLLSYAGALDPGTGRTWGGVVASGVRLGLSADRGGDYGTWASLGLHRLTGRHVQDNDQLRLMAGGYRRLVNEADRQLAVGVTGMSWRSSENAGEFTFGHGGYYSPGTYRSLAFPVTYAWRTALSSFALRASVSVAWSKSRQAAFYPTDPDLQARAEALVPVSGIDPFHEGGSNGHSFGSAFAAVWERQVMPNLFVGARVELERSINYTPNRFLLYLRLATQKPAARPPAMPPEPVLPSSHY